MGTSRSAAELSKKLNGIATGIPKATKAGVRQASLAGKATIIQVAGQRGVHQSSRIAGAKWSVGFDLKGSRHVTALLRIRGQFHLVESDTRAHVIPRARARRGRRRKALVIGGNVRTRVTHPGTRGKHIFRDSKDRIERQTPGIVMRQITLEMSQRLND